MLTGLDVIDLGFGALRYRAYREKAKEYNDNARKFYQILLPFQK